MEKLLSSLQKVEVGYNVASSIIQQTLPSSASVSSLVFAATLSLSWETNDQLWNYLKRSGALQKLPLSVPLLQTCLTTTDFPLHGMELRSSAGGHTGKNSSLWSSL